MTAQICGFAAALALVSCCSTALAAVVPLDKPAMSVRVEAGDYTVGGRKVRVPSAVDLPIAAPERDRVKREEQVIVEDQPMGHIGGTVLSKTMGPVDTFTRYPKAIDPDSVRVYSSTDPAEVYKEGVDYRLDHIWGGVTRVATGSIPKDAKLFFDYAMILQRVDLVQTTRAGKVSIKQGKSAVTNVEAPAPDKGCVALAAVWVPFRVTGITSDLILPMPADKIAWRSFIKTSGREHLANTLRLLRDKKSVTVVCWGDSVTERYSPSSYSKCYVELFRARLQQAYPHTPINLINAGIGGSNTDSRRDGFEKEVLSHNPDLITVEFVNDVGMGPAKIKTNWAEFVSRARAKNPTVEFIFITPHHMLPEWAGGFSNAVDAMRQAAVDNKAALADAENIWANLNKVGIPYETLLANGINHPNDLGHEFFAACLMELMAGK